ncbi:hypothetical protein PUNSTDRAFT_117775 [Punctularia strigosozonata HHB-11173 SS5]|uniref:uncharacterized protein n=1 Tax=Punctularia strigosozonata (strain HHB-11173) TaxID=741275 RepID=UPI0004416736|nr:uncharacterized protein PUNSTDRAFT_117775 [Punctularia strigosozonata HHB-11173 SS5]EIN14222.1 hypothetical protein PUNSTDRAFT_117775 [Punctularia strigosozonata HHB-11173 SS5]
MIIILLTCAAGGEPTTWTVLRSVAILLQVRCQPRRRQDALKVARWQNRRRTHVLAARVCRADRPGWKTRRRRSSE